MQLTVQRMNSMALSRKLSTTRIPPVKKIVYVGVTDEFAGHGIGSTNSFINFFRRPDQSGDFHPNADGYRFYAHAILAELRGKLLDEPAQLA
jgi:hypothetical protein